MITKLGIVAGEIWHLLEDHDRSIKIEEVIERIGRPREIVLMSIGWLAREGHVYLEGEGSEQTVILKEEKI